jgi:hypothetical protein
MGDFMVPGVGVNPAQILIGSLPKRFLADALHLLYLSEEVHDVFGTRQRREVPANHDAVKAVIGKTNGTTKQSKELFHRFLLLV